MFDLILEQREGGYMFSVNELLSKRNQRDAFVHFSTKKESCGPDKMKLSELQNFWQLNHERIEQEIRKSQYQPGIVHNFEVFNGKGKKRIISNINVIDRFILRLLAQKLKRYLEPEFLSNSFAYQDGKGILDAVTTAYNYMQEGKTYVAELDILNFFDTIPLDSLYMLLQKRFYDSAVLFLLKSYLYCQIFQENKIKMNSCGVIQGSSISPVLSNLYLHSLDSYMENKHYSWVRFADDIRIFASTQKEAEQIFSDISQFISDNLQLNINSQKSGVFSIFSHRFLGYDFYQRKGKIEIKKHEYTKNNVYHIWHQDSIKKIQQNYHIIQNGILNKKDYALLFENDAQKHYIPVEATEQLNIYSDITFTSNVLKTIHKQNIRIGIFDCYGNLIGYFLPEKFHLSFDTKISQCQIYLNVKKRIQLAKSMENAYIHNMRANIRYYNKKNSVLNSYLVFFNQAIKDVRVAVSVDELLLIEARIRQNYYNTFNSILQKSEFIFSKRTRRPPKDALNAMISFGNTLLYQLLLQIIWKSSLDPQIGIIHSSRKRAYNLHLDFADIFKPIIVDRIIFTLINCHQIKSDEHFQVIDNGGVYLNDEGKRLFIHAFEEKLAKKFSINNTQYTYKQIMEKEIQNFKKYILENKKYKPFKYY